MHFSQKRTVPPPEWRPLIVNVMKITVLLITVACLHLSAASFSQGISLQARQQKLEDVLAEIERQSGYQFFYNDKLMAMARPVDVNLTNATLEEALAMCFADQPLGYAIVDKTIVIKEKEQAPPPLRDVITVKGKVTDKKGEALPGVAVQVKGTTRGTVTDSNGEFSIDEVDDQSVLVFSFVGFKKIERSVDRLTQIEVTLEEDITSLDEVIVTAYNTTTERANTAAITVVKGDAIASLPNASIDKNLQGLVPGLLVTKGNGQPGSSPVNFVLRGIGTGGQPTNGETFRNPLIVVDGIPVSQESPRSINSSDFSPPSNPMAHLNPSDVQSISVLKDAAAVALYGSKASNGVILITTKKGTGKTTLNFRSQLDISTPLNGQVEMLDPGEYMELLYEAYRNSNPGITEEEITADLTAKFLTKEGETFYSETGWTEEFYNKRAVSTNNDISFSGGSDKSNFYIGVGWNRQDGIVKNTGFDRKSLRFNYSYIATNWLKINLHSTLSYNHQKLSNDDGSFYYIQAISPLNPIRDEQGEFINNYSWGLAFSGNQFRSNPIAAAALNINQNTAYRGLSKLDFDINFLNNFTFNTAIGGDFILSEIKEKKHPNFVLENESASGVGSIAGEDARTANLINTNTIRYNRRLGQHAVNLMAGHEAQVLTRKNTFISYRGIGDNPSQDQIFGNQLIRGASRESRQTLLSYFGQANYSFDARYYLSASIRSDGSSNFGTNNRFNSFWSIGLGWELSQEAFLKLVNPLNLLKLRGSFGPAGNSFAIRDYYQYDPIYISNVNNTIFAYQNPFAPPGNPSIKWEETFAWDVGLELKLFDNRLSVISDYYVRKTDNLIADNVRIVSSTGYYSLPKNIGNLKNSGIELSISGTILKKERFEWSTNIVFSKNNNRLTKANEKLQLFSAPIVNKEGEEYNSFYLKKWAGVNPSNGRPLWLDSLGNPSEDYRAAKEQIVGKVQPDGFGSLNNTFSWKGLQLSVRLYFQYGGHIYLNSVLQNDGSNPYLNQTRSALDRWQKPGDIAQNPRRLIRNRIGSETDLGMRPSTRFLYKNDFIRLATVDLTYQVPKSLLNSRIVNNLTVFIQGNNLATWTPYLGQDPENINSSGTGGMIYPQQKSYSFGVNVEF